jgi:hypothetical protein
MRAAASAVKTQEKQRLTARMARASTGGGQCGMSSNGGERISTASEPAPLRGVSAPPRRATRSHHPPWSSIACRMAQREVIL